MILRRETHSDWAAIAAVHSAAFAREPGVEPPEGRLVDALRDGGDLLTALSIVALSHGEIVGHVACSRGHIGDRPVAGLGPLGVLPAHQNLGVGTALMHAVLAAADAVYEPAVVLLGDPGFYRRFGFLPARDFDVMPPNTDWADHFQLRPLTAWDSIPGAFRYAAAFAAT